MQRPSLPLLTSLASLLLASACVSAAAGPVPVELGSQGFLPGDAIVIEEVWSTTGDLREGAEVVVSGRVSLASHELAQLYLGTTSVEPALYFGQVIVEAGTTPFELAHVLPASGRPHLSFYDIHTGAPFGGVSFGTGVYLQAAKAWDAEAVIAGE